MPTGGGGGGGGLSTVTTNTSLTGAGTSGSPLGVRGWPITYWYGGVFTTALKSPGANEVYISGFVLPAQLTFSKIAIVVGTTDAVNNSDFGIYTAAGALIANQGPATVTGNNLQLITMTQGSQTISPGKYIFAWTSAANTLTIYGLESSQEGGWVYNNNYTSSSSGTLPASITAPSANGSVSTLWFNLL